MDAYERRRKRQRREAKEKRLEAAAKRYAEPTVRPALKKGQRYTGKVVLYKPQTPAQYAKETQAKKERYNQQLYAALQQFEHKTRSRLKAALAMPLEHLTVSDPLMGRSRNDNPVFTGSSKKGSKALAKAFREPKPSRGERVARTEARKTTSTKAENKNNEPDKRKSDPPREKMEHCKERPKHNRPKSKGGGKRGFIPWC